MSGFVGGGGLGTIAINYGYYRSQSDVMLVMAVILVLIVQGFQEIGNRISKRSDKRIRKP
jgi:D-methionine transport system permease protein